MSACRRAAGIGGPLLGAAGVSWLRAALAGTLRVEDDGLSPALHVAMWLALGGLFAVAAVNFLRAHAEAARWPLGRLVAGALLIQLAAAPALPLTSSDLFANLAYGRLSALGGNPYLQGPSALPAGDPFLALVYPRWRDTPTAYGPVAAAINALAGRAGSVAGALIAYKLLLLGVALAFVGVAWACCRRLDGERAAASFVCVAWNPLFAWEIAGQAHNDGLMVLATAAFVWGMLGGRERAAMLALAAALWTKFAVAPLVALQLAWTARRAPLRALGWTVATLAVGVMLFLPYWQGAASLQGPLATVGLDTSRHTRSLTDLLWWAATPLGPAAQRLMYRTGQILGALVLGGFAVIAVARARSGERVRRDALILLLLYDTVGTPWFQPWYVTWLLPLVLVEEAGWQRLVAVYSALTLVQYGLPIDPLTHVAINCWVWCQMWWLMSRPRAAAPPHPP